MRSFYGLAALIVSLSLAACADRATDDAQEAGSDTAAAAAPANQPAQAVPSDAEIADIVKTANDADIDGGNLAKSKARNAEVKSFANLMIADHTAMNQQSAQVAQAAGIAAASNPTSQQMLADHQTARQRLEAQSGAEFDKAYIAHEVDMHQKVLDVLDQTLIPNAQNPELRNVLAQARARVEAHLTRARDIQGKLSN